MKDSFLVLVIAVGLVAGGCSPPRMTTAESSSPQFNEEAYRAAEELCRETLKRPSSIKFWALGKAGTAPKEWATEDSTNVYHALGTLEFQTNSGVMITNDWEVYVQRFPDRWEAVYIRLGDSEYGSNPAKRGSPESSQPEPLPTSSEGLAAKKAAKEELERREAEARAQTSKAQAGAEARRQAEIAQKKRKVLDFQLVQASNGYPSFQYEVAMRYAVGNGLEQDMGLARHWLVSAMTNGSVEASNAFKKLFDKP